MLDGFAKGAPVKPGPQIDRQFSAPFGGPDTLTSPGLYDNPPASGGAGTGTTDDKAKKPGEMANVREAPVPQPPLGDGGSGVNTARRE